MKRAWSYSQVLLLLLGCIPLGATSNQGSPANPFGEAERRAFVHDPSSIVECNGAYWCFSTGNFLASRYSTNLVDWQRGPAVFSQSPAWAKNAVAGNRGHFWAPDLICMAGRYYLYYSVSTWGSTVSSIGLATNDSLDPADPRFRWADQGPVVTTSSQDNYNAIDPSVMLDRDGRLWMAFGSYWSGVKLIELNPQTGHRITTNSPLYSIAWNDSIEAACLVNEKEYYYLFVNWGQCCRGTNSTYQIRVGRSREVTGPYLDKAGRDLMLKGGSLFLGTKGKEIGPGHAALLRSRGKAYVSYHFYDGAQDGRPSLRIRSLEWNKAGWPEPGEIIVGASSSDSRTPTGNAL
jgi:arabinan endo-1,5-alpha-L-arabinosidase